MHLASAAASAGSLALALFAPFALRAPTVQQQAPAPPPRESTIFLLDALERAQVGDTEAAAPAAVEADYELGALESAGSDPAEGRFVFALPLPAARREAERPVAVDLLRADGSAIALQRGGEAGVRARIVGSSQLVECESHAAFRGLPRRTFAKTPGVDFRGVYVDHDAAFALRFERLGGRASLHWRGAFLKKPRAPARLPRIEVVAEGKVLGELDFRESGAEQAGVELPPASGSRELVLRVVYPEPVAAQPTGGVVFDRIEMRERLDGRDRLVVRMPELDPKMRVRYAAQPPSGAARLPAGDAARELDVQVVAGEAAIFSSTAQPLRATLDGAPLAEGDGTRRELALRFDARAVRRLRVTAPDGGPPKGDVWFVQPDALALTGATLGRGRFAAKALESGAPLHVGCRDDTRRALLVPVGGVAELAAPCRDGDVLECSLALKQLVAEPLPLDPVEVELTLVGADASERTLLRTTLSGFDRWSDQRLELRGVAPGGTLRLRTAPASSNLEAAPLATRLVRVAFAEPTLVRTAAPATPNAPRPPNVLVYLIDALRGDHTSLLGYSRPTTPRLEALGRDAVVFEQAWAQAPWTRPAVASLFCGVLPSYHGAGKRTGLAGDDDTLAELLRATGRSTAAFIANSKVHAGGLFFEQGFCTFVATDRPDTFVRSDEMNDALIPWLERHRARPFFAYVHTLDPHAPYDPPPATRGRFEADYQGFVTSQITIHQLDARAPIAPADLAQVVALYDEEILFNDLQLGVLIDALKRLDLYDETLIVVVSDHGEEFQEHGAFGHGGRLWRELLHVPLVVKLPKSRGVAPARVAAPVRQLDVLPTILAAVDPSLAAPPLQGVDLRPWMRGDEVEPLAAIAEEEPDLRSLIEGGFHLIQEKKGTDGGRLWLFDLAADRAEQSDLAAAQPARARALLGRLDSLFSELDRRGFPRRLGRDFEPQARDVEALDKLGYTDR
jgi:arylsulfatase A-like enzyme